MDTKEAPIILRHSSIQYSMFMNHYLLLRTRMAYSLEKKNRTVMYCVLFDVSIEDLSVGGSKPMAAFNTQMPVLR